MPSTHKTFNLSPILFEADQKNPLDTPLNLEKFITGFATETPAVGKATKEHVARMLAQEKTRAKETGHKNVENIPTWSNLLRTIQLLEVLGRIAEKLKAAIINHKSFLKTMAENSDIVKYSRINPQVIKDVQKYFAS